jgi:hypothetical protein
LLRGSEQIEDDKQKAVIFAKVLAGEPINRAEIGKVERYMENLVKDFAPPPTPPQLGAAVR